MEKKDVSEKDAKLLKEAATQLAKIPSNSLCADCHQQCTLWASVNIGVFICSRCAGMHRHLGVHITQVRSINLDVWTPSQLVSVLVNGNAYVNSWLMSKPGAPDIGRRRISDTSMSRHIIEKYEKHRFGDTTGLLLVDKTTFPGLTVEKALKLFKMAMTLHRQQNDHCSIRIELLKVAGYRGLENVLLKNPLNKQLVLLPDPTMFVFNEIKKTPYTAQIVTVKAQVPTMTVSPVVAKQDKLVDLDEFTDFTSSAPVFVINDISDSDKASTFGPFPTTVNVKSQVNGFANFALADTSTIPIPPKPVISKSIIDIDFLSSDSNDSLPAAVSSPIVDTGFANFVSNSSFNGSDSFVKNNDDLVFSVFGSSISSTKAKVDPTWPSTSSTMTTTNDSFNAFDTPIEPAVSVTSISTAPAPMDTPVLPTSNDVFPDLFAAPPPSPDMRFPSVVPLNSLSKKHVISTAPTTTPIGGGGDVDFILSLYKK